MQLECAETHRRSHAIDQFFPLTTVTEVEAMQSNVAINHDAPVIKDVMACSVSAEMAHLAS